MASFPPTIIIPGTVPPSAVDLLTSALYGPPQVTKTNRGVLPMADLPGSGAGSYGAFTGFRDDTPYGVRSTAEISHGSSSGMLPPSLYGDMSAYQADPRMVSRTRDPNGGYSPPLRAIDTATAPKSTLPTGVPVPRSPWGPAWGVGINPDLIWGSSPAGAQTTDDAWQTDRFGEPVTRQPGFATGNRIPTTAPATHADSLLRLLLGGDNAPVQHTTPPNRPIVQVAPTPFVPDSPGGMFEKQNGQGSATQSMLNSSRWQTGY